jgi:hypothetical protein
MLNPALFSPRFQFSTGQVIKAMLTAGVLIIIGTGVNSLPRLSAEQSLPCRTCHINPNGGGMRTEFGNQTVALHELCIPPTRDLIASKAISPRIAPALLVGFDTRYLVEDDGTILRMQTDAYADVTPWPQFHYALRFGESGISESYGLLYFNDEHYYIKLGRFYPVYGLRDADHTAFVRARTGHPAQQYLDGLSLGADLKGLNISVEGFDVSGQNVFGAHAYCSQKVVGLGVLAGASGRVSEKIEGKNGLFPYSRSLFGGLSWNRFTLMGEADLVGYAPDTLITYVNFTTRIVPGLYLIGEYNFFDGDRHLMGGVDEFVRVSCELFPLPYVEIRPSYTYYTRGALEETDNFFVQVHLGY